jgi:hypothetical protein
MEDRIIGGDLFQLDIDLVQEAVSRSLDIDLVIGGLIRYLMDLAYEEGSIEMEEFCAIADLVGLFADRQGGGTRRQTGGNEGLHT